MGVRDSSNEMLFVWCAADDDGSSSSFSNAFFIEASRLLLREENVDIKRRLPPATCLFFLLDITCVLGLTRGDSFKRDVYVDCVARFILSTDKTIDLDRLSSWS